MTQPYQFGNSLFLRNTALRLMVLVQGSVIKLAFLLGKRQLSLFSVDITFPLIYTIEPKAARVAQW